MGTAADLDAWWVEITDYNESNAAKATFQATMQNIDEQLNELKRAYDAGEYDKLPASVRTKFVWAWQHGKDSYVFDDVGRRYEHRYHR